MFRFNSYTKATSLEHGKNNKLLGKKSNIIGNKRTNMIVKGNNEGNEKYKPKERKLTCS